MCLIGCRCNHSQSIIHCFLFIPTGSTSNDPRPGNTVSTQSPGLGIGTLDVTVHRLTLLGFSNNTLNSHRLGVRRYLLFCARFHILGFQLVLCRFTAYLVQEGLSYSSIRQYLCSLRCFQLLGGGPVCHPFTAFSMSSGVVIVHLVP